MDTVLPSQQKITTGVKNEFHQGRSRSIVMNLERNYSQNDSLDFYGHSKPVYSVNQDSMDGRYILSSAGDETIRLWDTSLRQCVGKYPCLSVSWSVVFNPLDYYFASGNQDRSVTMFATDRTSPLRLLVGHVSDVTACCWHPNGTMICSGSDDKTVRLWDIRDASCIRLLQGCPTEVSSIACSRDGTLLAGGTITGSIMLWDIRTTRALALLRGHQSQIYSLAFSEDSISLSSGGADSTIRVWDLTRVNQNHDQLSEAVNSNTFNSTQADNTVADYPNGSSLYNSKPPDSLYLINPSLTLHTKYTAVYYLNYTKNNMMYAGGPFSIGNSLT
jgi:transcription initiation factor TFIID subunit 5